jgi:hypothetical protein
MSAITYIDPGQISTADPTIIAFNTSTSTPTGSTIASGKTIEVVATENCYIAFGASPVAAATTHFLVANTYKRFRLRGDYKIAALGQINSGSLYISVVL